MPSVGKQIETAYLESHFLLPEAEIILVDSRDIGDNQCEQCGDNQDITTRNMASYRLSGSVKHTLVSLRF